MDTFCGIPAVTDDALFRRAAAEKLEFEDEADAYGWLAQRHYDTGAWPRCGCETRCRACPDVRFIRSCDGRLAFQQVDPSTGRPRPPEWERYRAEAACFAGQHLHAQTWLPDSWVVDKATVRARTRAERDQPTYLGYPVADLVSPDH